MQPYLSYPTLDRNFYCEFIFTVHKAVKFVKVFQYDIQGYLTHGYFRSFHRYHKGQHLTIRGNNYDQKPSEYVNILKLKGYRQYVTNSSDQDVQMKKEAGIYEIKKRKGFYKLDPVFYLLLNETGTNVQFHLKYLVTMPVIDRSIALNFKTSVYGENSWIDFYFGSFQDINSTSRYNFYSIMLNNRQTKDFIHLYKDKVFKFRMSDAKTTGGEISVQIRTKVRVCMCERI